MSTASASLKKYIDLKLILLLAGFYALFDVVFIIKIYYMRVKFPRSPVESWYDFLVLNLLIDWIIVVVYMTLIAISTKRFLHKNYSWVRIIVIHMIFSILIGFVIRLIFDVFGLVTGHIPFEEYQVEDSLDRFVYVMDLNFLIYFAMVFIIYTYYYVKQVREAEQQRSVLENQLVHTRMKMLSSQLQPHFLFNTLNSIAVLADLDKEKAKDTIVDLSDFLREILYSGEENEISLEKELRTLEYYLNIINVRFSDHLKIIKKIDQDLLSCKVPALILQPLIENSIKHGYSYDHTDLVIEIEIQKVYRQLQIKVANDGEPIDAPEKRLFEKGMGFTNLKDRLHNLYGNNYFLQLRNRRGQAGVETVIRIPLT